MRSEFEIRPATKEDFEEIYGYPPERSIYGYSGYIDDRPVAIAGIYYYPDQCVAFCNILPEAYNCRMGLARGAIRILRMIKEKGISVYAIADPSIPSSEDFIMRCGFEYLTKGPNGQVFVARNETCKH